MMVVGLDGRSGRLMLCGILMIARSAGGGKPLGKDGIAI